MKKNRDRISFFQEKINSYWYYFTIFLSVDADNHPPWGAPPTRFGKHVVVRKENKRERKERQKHCRLGDGVNAL